MTTIEPEIKLSNLIRQRYEMKAIGVTTSAFEVGPVTWKFLLDEAERGTGEKWPEDYKRAETEGFFMGISVRCGNVPEGKLWPLETPK